MFSTGPFVHPFFRYQSCKYDVLQTDEQISLQTGTSDLPDKSMKQTTLGVNRSKVTVTGGQSPIWRPDRGTILPSPLGRVGFLVLNYKKKSDNNAQS